MDCEWVSKCITWYEYDYISTYDHHLLNVVCLLWFVCSFPFIVASSTALHCSIYWTRLFKWQTTILKNPSPQPSKQSSNLVASESVPNSESNSFSQKNGELNAIRATAAISAIRACSRCPLCVIRASEQWNQWRWPMLVPLNRCPNVNSTALHWREMKLLLRCMLESDQSSCYSNISQGPWMWLERILSSHLQWKPCIPSSRWLLCGIDRCVNPEAITDWWQTRINSLVAKSIVEYCTGVCLSTSRDALCPIRDWWIDWLQWNVVGVCVYLHQQMGGIPRNLVHVPRRVLDEVGQCLANIVLHLDLVPVSPRLDVNNGQTSVDQSEVQVGTVDDLQCILDDVHTALVARRELSRKQCNTIRNNEINRSLACWEAVERNLD